MPKSLPGLQHRLNEEILIDYTMADAVEALGNICAMRAMRLKQIGMDQQSLRWQKGFETLEECAEGLRKNGF